MDKWCGLLGYQKLWRGVAAGAAHTHGGVVRGVGAFVTLGADEV